MDYITYSSGEVARQALNTIAAFCSSDEFASLQSIALLFGAVATMYLYTTSRDHNHIIRWFVVFGIIPMTLINTKATMQIIDKTNPAYTASVANVPYIVALPSHFMGQLMSGLVEKTEAIAALPDDERYGRTGMMFGSKLFLMAQAPKLQDTTAQGIWNEFFQNCIRGDIEINAKYAWKDIYDNPDIFSFLDTQSMSGLRGVLLPNGAFKTCNDIYPDIKTAFSSDALNHINKLGSYLYENQAASKMSFLRSSIENAYSTYGSISTNSDQIFLQNMAINAIRNSVHDMGNTTGLAMNYAYTSNRMQTTSMWMSVGLQAQEFVPMIHTIFFLMFSCFSFVIVLVALIPHLTMTVLGNYFKTFGFLALHPFVFAILNSIMNWSLEARSSGFTDDFGGFTLSNANAVDEIHTRFAAIAGYLMMSTPLIAGGMLKGGGAIFSSLNYGLAGMVNSVAGRTSTAVATGDISQGNTSINTHNWDNQTAHQHNTAPFSKTFGSTEQQQDGTFRHTLGNGQIRYSVGDSISQTPWSGQTQKMIQDSVTHNLNESQQDLNQWSNQINASNNVTAGHLNQYGASLAQNDNYSERSAVSASSNLTSSVTNMQSAIDSISAIEGFSKNDAMALASSFSAQSTLGGGLPPVTPFIASATTSGAISSDTRETFDNLSQEQKQELYQNLVQYHDGASSVLGFNETSDTSQLNSQTKQWVDNFSANYQNTLGANQSALASYQEVDSLSHIKSKLDSGGVQFNENVVEPFHAFVRAWAQGEEETQRIMMDTTPSSLFDRQKLWNEFTSTDEFVKAFSDITLPNKDQFTDNSTSSFESLDYKEFQDMIYNHSVDVNGGAKDIVVDRYKEGFVVDSLFDHGKSVSIEGSGQIIENKVNNQNNTQPPTPPPTGTIEAQFRQEQERSNIGRVTGNAPRGEPTQTEHDYGSQRPKI